jgi:hypothetical protein
MWRRAASNEARRPPQRTETCDIGNALASRAGRRPTSRSLGSARYLVAYLLCPLAAPLLAGPLQAIDPEARYPGGPLWRDGKPLCVEYAQSNSKKLAVVGIRNARCELGGPGYHLPRPPTQSSFNNTEARKPVLGKSDPRPSDRPLGASQRFLESVSLLAPRRRAD